MNEDVHNPFGYGTPPRSPDRQFDMVDALDSCETPPAASPGEGEGTPKVPLLPFAGRPGQSCPGAPKKGRAPNSFYDHVSGEAPVRRLSFSRADSADCSTPEPAGDMAVDSMEEEDCLDGQQTQQAQCQPAQQTPAPPAQPSQLSIPRQAQSQDQLLLSPSPPPMQQQLWSQQHLTQQQQQQQQHPRPTSVQQQLFATAPHSNSWQQRPQQVWPCQQTVAQQQQGQPLPASLLQNQQSLHQQHQQLWPNPLSPPAAMRPSAAQGSTTPARLFR